MANHFENVNDEYECLELLEKINGLINTLFKLSDTNYYLDYIFNGSGGEDALALIGVDSDYFSSLASKFEQIRTIVYGESIDWNGLVRDELKEVAKSQHNQLKENDKFIKNLLRDTKKLEKENALLKKEELNYGKEN